MSENFNDNSYIDSLIIKHRKKLDELKSGQSNKKLITYQKHNQTYTFKNDCSLNDENNIGSDRINTDQFEFRNLKIQKLEKLVNDYSDENSKLKFQIQKLQEELKFKNSHFNSSHFEYDKKSNIFYEREKELIETLKLMDLDNRKLTEKLEEQKLLMTEKQKEVYSLKQKLNDSFDGKNFQINQIGIDLSKSKNDEELFWKEMSLKSLKLEKIINLFQFFFMKLRNFKDFPSEKIIQNIKNNEIEDLQSNLKNFELVIKSLYEGIISSKDREICHNQSFSNKNSNSPTSPRNTLQQTMNSENDYSKLEIRLKELENNFKNLSQQDSKISNSSRNKLAMNNSSSHKRLPTSSGKKVLNNSQKIK
jgi:hypothetical protein